MTRMATIVVFAAVAAGGGSAHAITGNQPEFRKLAEDVYVYIGKLNDSNAMAIVTSEGVVLVDTGNNTTDTRALLKHVQSVTKQPVRYVVITQNHNDHSGGAALFSPPAKTIVHERVAKQWANLKPHQMTAWRRRFPERTAALERLNPTDTIESVSGQRTLRLGGTDIQLIYVDDPYNPGDIAVWLPKQRVLHASMAGYKDRHPDIRPDYSHGTTEGLLKQLKAYITLRPQLVVPAHGPVGGGWILEGMIEYLLLARDSVQEMMKKGLPLATIEREFQMKSFSEWDRTEHLPWMAATIHRELQGLGPQAIKTVERRVSGVVASALQDGRRVTVTAGNGMQVVLRVTGDTVFEGIGDRTEVRTGMKVAAVYEVPEGIVPTLGYDTLEFTVSR
ncbi:MAG: MBL fold metallo-hydrolase [Acidobacteria bacterium]|nr:MBL fold metallo-hydrolase [Acidobacteriota bacterium]